MFGFKKRKQTRIDPAFGGAGRGRLRGWVVSGSGPNTNIVNSVGELRRRSRDLSRNFPYMNAAYATVASNIVGPGINIKPRHDDCEVCNKLRELWDDWTQDCTIDGTDSLNGLLTLAVRERWEAGECFIRFIPVKEGVVPLKLQIIPADQCKLDENDTNSDGGKTVGGIRFDAMGRIISYTFYKENPTESVASRDTYSTIDIPAEQICHYFRPLLAGQVRGVPEAFSALVKSREMLEYDEAELTRKKIAACYSGFITTPNPDGALNADDEDEDAGIGEAVASIEPGTISVLAPGEDIKFNGPAESGSSYEPFMNQNLRQIAAAIGLTYEEFSNDMSKANFSSIRAGLNITQRKCRQEQERLVHQVLRKVWREFVKTAVLSGALDVSPREYNEHPEHFLRATFQTPGWAYVNPQQEVAAQKEKVLCGFASRSQIISENGGDAAEVDRQVADDANRAESLGLVYTTDPTNGKGAPITNAEEANETTIE